jgi:hypothetical protein
MSTLNYRTLARGIIETLINAMYLMQNESKELYDSFVEYSLRHEKNLMKLIERNIEARGFESPIETRMKKSINATFQKSGVSIEQVNEKNRSPWGGTIYRKLKALKLEETYLGLFGGPSHSVHGNWQDIFTNDLEYRNRCFYSANKHQRVRPQLLGAIAFFVIKTGSMYSISRIRPCNERKTILKRLVELRKISKEIIYAHEKFLMDRQE